MNLKKLDLCEKVKFAREKKEKKIFTKSCIAKNILNIGKLEKKIVNSHPKRL